MKTAAWVPKAASGHSINPDGDDAGCWLLERLEDEVVGKGTGLGPWDTA
jgi:hypothetical protein